MIGTNWFFDKTNQWNSWSAISSENITTRTLSIDFVHTDKSARAQWTTTCFSIPTLSFPSELWKLLFSDIQRKMLAFNSIITRRNDLGFWRQKKVDGSVCSSVWILAFWVSKPTTGEGCSDIPTFFYMVGSALNHEAECGHATNSFSEFNAIDLINLGNSSW